MISLIKSLQLSYLLFWTTQSHSNWLSKSHSDGASSIPENSNSNYNTINMIYKIITIIII